MSTDTLSIGGLSANVTFGEMLSVSAEDLYGVDGLMGMGLPNKEGQSAFEDMVDVSC